MESTMNRKSAAHLPEVPGVDLEFRPSSYFRPLDLEAYLLTSVKGAERRAVLKRIIEAEGVNAIPDCLAQPALNEANRRAIGRMHPAFMGGEYLPDRTAREVEIARISIASTTQDVVCVYARRGKRRIYYRVVDEYQGGTLSGRTKCSSIRPLTLGQLESLLNGSWSLFEVLEMNFGGDGYDVQRMLNFVTSVESGFYPQIRDLYARRIEAWAAEQQKGARATPTETEVNERIGECSED
jgi:hypothetical protein